MDQRSRSPPSGSARTSRVMTQNGTLQPQAWRVTRGSRRGVFRRSKPSRCRKSLRDRQFERQIRPTRRAFAIASTGERAPRLRSTPFTWLRTVSFEMLNLLSHLRSRVTAGEKRKRLAFAWAEPWRACGGWLDFFENLGESDTSDHGAVGVLERNRTYCQAHAPPVSARDRHLQLCM